MISLWKPSIVFDIWYPVWLFRYIYRTYDDQGKCTPIGGAHRSATMRTHNLQKPARLYWDISPKLAGIIENAVRVAQKVNILPKPLWSSNYHREKETFPRLCSKTMYTLYYRLYLAFLADTKSYQVKYEQQWPGTGTSHSHTLNMVLEWLARKVCNKSYSLLLNSIYFLFSGFQSLLLLFHYRDSLWPYTCRCSHCTKVWQKTYLHDIWCSIFKINTGNLCFLTEITPKSLFLKVNKSPIQYNNLFSCWHKSYAIC